MWLNITAEAGPRDHGGIAPIKKLIKSTDIKFVYTPCSAKVSTCDITFPHNSIFA